MGNETSRMDLNRDIKVPDGWGEGEPIRINTNKFCVVLFAGNQKDSGDSTERWKRCEPGQNQRCGLTAAVRKLSGSEDLEFLRKFRFRPGHLPASP